MECLCRLRPRPIQYISVEESTLSCSEVETRVGILMEDASMGRYVVPVSWGKVPDDLQGTRFGETVHLKIICFVTITLTTIASIAIAIAVAIAEVSPSDTVVPCFVESGFK